MHFFFKKNKTETLYIKPPPLRHYQHITSQSITNTRADKMHAGRLYILLCVMMASGAVRAQVDTPEGDIAQSVQNTANDLAATGLTTWGDTCFIFEQMNAQWAIVANGASRLYNATSQVDVEAMLTVPECVVRPVGTLFDTDTLTHLRNATTTHEFLCCHRMRLSPLRRIVEQATRKFLEGATDSLGSLPEETLLNIRDMMANDRLGFLSGACKDDLTIHTPELRLVRALSARLVGGNLLSAYEFLAINIQSMLNCVEEPVLPAYCLTSDPLELSDSGIAALVYESNPQVAEFCSASALSDFETYRLTATCS